MEEDSKTAASSGHKIAETVREPLFLALGLRFMYPASIFSVVVPTVPSTRLPNPNSNSATGNFLDPVNQIQKCAL